MTYHSLSLCRICLEDGATLPIFEDTKEENSILYKIYLCMNENVIILYSVIAQII